MSVQQTALEAVRNGLVHSAHDCSEGGLAAAVAESCISSDDMIGARIELENGNERTDALLFGESQSRIIISCSKQNLSKIEKIADKYNALLTVIGRTGGNELEIYRNDSRIISLPLSNLHDAWAGALEKSLKEG